VKRYVGGTVKGPREEWIAGMRRNLDLLLCVTVKATGDFAGRASLTQPGLPSEEAGLQVLIARQYWGFGFGREASQLLIDAAFEHLGARSVVAVVHPDNRASRDMCERLGFCCVGTKQYPTGQEKWDNGHLIFKRLRTNNNS
jgi:RimJ/RimL family protein N-acetyltransferase